MSAPSTNLQGQPAQDWAVVRAKVDQRLTAGQVVAAKVSTQSLSSDRASFDQVGAIDLQVDTLVATASLTVQGQPVTGGNYYCRSASSAGEPLLTVPTGSAGLTWPVLVSPNLLLNSGLVVEAVQITNIVAVFPWQVTTVGVYNIDVNVAGAQAVQTPAPATGASVSLVAVRNSTPLPGVLAQWSRAPTDTTRISQSANFTLALTPADALTLAFLNSGAGTFEIYQATVRITRVA